MLLRKLVILCLVLVSFGALFVFGYFFPSPGLFFVLATFLFCSLFFIGYVFEYAWDNFYASVNTWVETVEDMNFWFNRMFMTWLFVKNRKRWARATTIVCLLMSFWLCPFILFLLFRNHLEASLLASAFLIAAPITTFVALAWYQRYC